MTDWARARFGLGGAVFVNHSGLSDATRLTAAEQVAVLLQAAAGGLPGLLRPRPILDAAAPAGGDRRGARWCRRPGRMDFVSALAGYMTGRRRLAFAIFAADPELRARHPAGGAGEAAGGRGLGGAGAGAGAGAAAALGGGYA